MTDRKPLGRRRKEALSASTHSAHQLSAQAKELFEALKAYGQTSDRHQIALLQGAYGRALLSVDKTERQSLWPLLIDLIFHETINPNPLLAMAICDPDRSIAATAALEFVCFSECDDNGSPIALSEFVHLLRTNVVANKGAVFGGLLALGDQRLTDFYLECSRTLDAAEMREASFACRSGRLFHATFDFWFHVLETLIERSDDTALSVFGDAAATLVGLPKSAFSLDVHVASRLYPAHHFDQPILVEHTWSWRDYTEFMMPRLKALFDREPAPQILPVVQDQWLALTDRDI